MTVKPAPAGWSQMSSSIFYQDAGAAIDWLSRAFGFTVRLRIEDEDGSIRHSELSYGDSVVMVGQAGSPGDQRAWKASMVSPRSVGGANTQSIMLYVDDADAHCAHARSCGATIVDEPATHDYGEDYWTDRSYSALDLEGHMWWITARVSTGATASVPHRAP